MYENLSTEEIYDKLPAMIQYHNDAYIGEYFLSFFKGNNRTIVQYKDKDGNSLAGTCRGDKNLRKAIISMREWLTEFNFNSSLEEFHKIEKIRFKNKLLVEKIK